MAPTFEQAWKSGISPLIEERIDEKEAFEKTAKPFHDFMLRQVRQKDLELFQDISGAEAGPSNEIPLQVLVPAFMISELKIAFLIGFQVIMPFLVIDLVVTSVTTSLGMIMLPPTMVSLPLKLIMFVLVDGWNLVVGMLMQSFSPYL